MVRRRAVRAALILVAALAVTAAVTSAVVAGRNGPPAVPSLGAGVDVYDGDVGDPFILSPAGTASAAGNATSCCTYYVYGTNDAPTHVPTASSTDLVHWTAGPDAMPELPSWAAPDPTTSLTWAPSVLDTGQGYLMYVTVHDAAADRQCIAATASAHALGPFVAIGPGPLVCQAGLGGSIDPSVVRDPSGGLHLLWKSDGNSIGQPAYLWEQDLDAGGTALLGPAHRLLGADRSWEGGIIERPEAARARGGGWWLFYSGNRFNRPAYATGVAYCQTLAGPCHDARTTPILSGSAGEFSAAGLNVFRTMSNGLDAAYATWTHPARNGRYYCCRALVIAPIRHL